MTIAKEKDWVLIEYTGGVAKGQLRAWRDYGNAWGSTVYTVLGYHTGTHKVAIAKAELLAMGMTFVKLEELDLAKEAI